MTLPLDQIKQLDKDDVIVEFLKWDLSRLGGGTYYITGQPPFPGGTVLSWNSNVLLSLPMQTSGWDESVDNLMPTPEVGLSNLSKAMFDVVNSTGDSVGGIVERWLIWGKNLDQGSAPDWTKAGLAGRFIVSKLARISETEIRFQLQVPYELINLQLPRERFLRDKGFPGVGKWRG